MRQSLLLLGIALMLSLGSCKNSSSGFTGLTKSGYPYTIHVDKSGDSPKVGDKVRFFETIRINSDSIIFSQEMTVVLPEESQVATPPPANYELLFLLSAGDTASVYVFDTLLTRIPNLTLDPGDTLIYDIGFKEIVLSKVDLENQMEDSKAKEEIVKARVNEATQKYLKGELNDILQTTPTGLKYVINENGSGNMPQPGQKLVVHYYGTLMDGTMFDNSYKRGEPFEFALGQGQVIPGWDEGLAFVPIGGAATLFIPYQLGYGEVGSPPTIPPKTDLVFFVELVDVK